MSKRRIRPDMLTVLLVAIGAMSALLVGSFVYALAHVPEDTLRWWAGLATAALPFALAAGYGLGRLVARERLAGLDQGVDRVMTAAQRTADLRGQAVREARQPAPPVDAGQIVIVPARMPELPGGRKVIEM